MDNRAIGVFDSGLGGLTTVAELKHILPNESIIYFGDTGRVPYGTRSSEIIRKYALQDINFLKSHDVKMIIAACGTVSSVLNEADVVDIGVAYTGVLRPTAMAAVKASRNGRIGVIGTGATIKSGSYEREIKRLIPDNTVISSACPLFVPLVENGFTNCNNMVTRLVAEQYLAPFIEQGVDTLILGCTHYPIISDIIGDIMGSGVTLINAGQQAALYSREFLTRSDMLNYDKSINYAYYVSDTVEEFERNASAILEQPVVGSIEKIDIEQWDSVMKVSL